jgi:hypothetical protein
VTLKSLVTGFVTAAAGAAVVAAAAGGVTSIASGAPSQAPAIQNVVWDIPLPQAPAPDLQAPLVQTLSALAGGGSFSGKQIYIEGGLGRIETVAADRKFKQKAAEGYFPLSFVVTDVDQNGPIATANVTATAATGGTATQPMTFIAGPSPTGWQVSKGSALALLSSVG